MFLLDDRIVYSASDLAVAATCEFALLRALDVKLGRRPDDPVAAPDALLARTAELGDAHERRTLERFRTEFGAHLPGSAGGVAEIMAPESPYTHSALEAVRDASLAVLRGGADVVFQASFFDGRFHGRSDFLVRDGDCYAVFDTKLARRAKVTALLQLAAYADQLTRSGIPVADDAVLLLGDGVHSAHRLADLTPVYLERRERLQAMLDEHHARTGPVGWNDERYLACGRCEACAAEVAAHRDVLLVAGLRTTQRVKLRAHGIETIEALAESAGPVPGMAQSTVDDLRVQAALQVAQDRRTPPGAGRPQVEAVVHATEPLATLPAPSAGDLFFDFEGDPLWTDDHDPTDWGLEYLFGVVEADTGRFVPFWAHDRAEEKRALRKFLDYIAARRTQHPDLRIYHYAAYEKTALLRLAGRHGIGEDEIDDLIRAGVLVDLYAVVRQSIRVSQPSYSIKKLEPLYMGDDLRAEDGVTSGADSVVEYARAMELRRDGDDDACQKALDDIADYNQYDCVSTGRLRDWLLARAAEHGIAPVTSSATAASPEDEPAADDDRLEAELLALAGDAVRAERTPEQQAYALLAASLGYHRREDKPFWWAHFSRLAQPVDEWIGGRDVFAVESGEVLTAWAKEGRQRKLRRRVRLVGDWGTGSTATRGGAVAVYDPPVPTGLAPPERCLRATTGVSIVESAVDASGRTALIVEELLDDGVDEHDQLPIALAPAAGPSTKSIEAALRELAERVLSDGLVAQPGIDLVAGRPPRTASGRLASVDDGDEATIEAVTASLTDLQSSYLAVQGPPGTGKTYLGARVVKRLVASGWRIGVVAQSHEVVEHFLDGVVKAGVPAAQVGKALKHPGERPWTVLRKDKYSDFLDDHAELGCVIGGTAWDFTSRSRVQRDQLDLLVVDEAGQFSLANTLAVSTAAQRLLLLGDPQQLPQVSQGTHPEPVEMSALGWLMGDHATLPPPLGYFLAHTWRMHPRLTAPVSRLAYNDRLRSVEHVTTARGLDGIEAGVHLVVVDHLGNSVESPEEADEVVTQIRRLLGRTWSDPSDASAPRPLGAGDILVVAAYNAQVAAIERALGAAGISGVRVGTVDRIQGREAPVVVVSMAASSPDDVPRGMGFLLLRNRINVAVSRAQWAAVVVRSPRLTRFLPSTPGSLADLGAFIALTHPLSTDFDAVTNLGPSHGD